MPVTSRASPICSQGRSSRPRAKSSPPIARPCYACTRPPRGATRTGTPHTKHLVTNLVIDVDDVAGTASARSYFTVLQSLPDFPLQPIIAGRYRDDFERERQGMALHRA